MTKAFKNSITGSKTSFFVSDSSYFFTNIATKVLNRITTTSTSNMVEIIVVQGDSNPNDDKKKLIQRFLEFGNKNLVVSNVKTSDFSNREIPVVIEGDIDLSNYIITEDKEVYAGIDFFAENLRSYIPDKKRQQDYELSSAFVAQDETELILPPGYKVASLPDAINEKAADIEVNASYSTKDNKVIFKKVLSIKSDRIRKSDFENWKTFIKKLKDFNSNLILIKKP
jgi:hypothetical protein